MALESVCDMCSWLCMMAVQNYRGVDRDLRGLVFHASGTYMGLGGRRFRVGRLATVSASITLGMPRRAPIIRPWSAAIGWMFGGGMS